MPNKMATSIATITSASVTPAQQQVVQNLVAALRQKSDETRHKAARDLFNYVSVDLREIPADNLNAVLDYIIKHMLDTVKGKNKSIIGLSVTDSARCIKIELDHTESIVYYVFACVLSRYSVIQGGTNTTLFFCFEKLTVDCYSKIINLLSPISIEIP